MTRNAALAKRKLGWWERGRNLKKWGGRLELVQIERTGGAGARTVKDMEVDHGCLYR